MKRLAIVYHSQSGATRSLALAAAAGARLEEDVEVRCVPALEADTALLLWADGIIFGSPENLGYLSGGLKDFFDRTFYTAAGKVDNKPYAVLISAGNDGSNALRQLQRIVSGY
ncbi:MAG TPA: NAD(P)H-dependent oxidoreductase, partial [Spongiibacteraceae bacterium]|nr:NAD(P)H-dependent oxidoreductase [Spongiibacteraceae bacterium]